MDRLVNEDLAYSLILEPDDNGTILVTCPDLPEVTTFGEDEDDALIRARDAIEEALAARIANRQDIPYPAHRGKTRVSLSTQVALKVLLYIAMREERMKKADLARALHWHGPQVDRLFDLRHATRLGQFDQAFAALGRQVRVSVLPS